MIIHEWDKAMVTRECRDTNPISLRDYCPNTPYGKTINDILKRVVNIEAEMMNSYEPIEIPDQKMFLKYVKMQRPKRFEPGLYNFVKYTIRQVLV